MVEDNDTCFTSDEFNVFMRNNGTKHIKSAPYHPFTNGLAERAVQTLKQGLKQLKQVSIETRVSRFLSSYRTTPQSTTGLSPSEMLFNRSQDAFLSGSIMCRETGGSEAVAAESTS